jgi:hypothetical protein
MPLPAVGGFWFVGNSEITKKRDQAEAVLPGTKNRGGCRVLIRHDLF